VEILSISCAVIEPQIHLTTDAVRDANNVPILAALIARLVLARLDYLISGDTYLLAFSRPTPLLLPRFFGAKHVA